LPVPVNEPFTTVIPARALAEVSRIIGDQQEPVQIDVTPARNQILFHMNNVDLVSQLIEGKFPDYRQIIPASHTTRAFVNTKALLQAVKTANIFARDAANIVRLQMTVGDDEFNPSKLTLMATAAEVGENVGEVDITIEGEPIEIAFNAKYLIDVLSIIDTEQTIIETSTSQSPGVFKPAGEDDVICVIMPMHFTK